MLLERTSDVDRVVGRGTDKVSPRDLPPSCAFEREIGERENAVCMFEVGGEREECLKGTSKRTCIRRIRPLG